MKPGSVTTTNEAIAMDKPITRWIFVVVVFVFALVLTGCGDDGKKLEPKSDPNLPKLEPKTPSGGGPGKGGKPSGPTGGIE